MNNWNKIKIGIVTLLFALILLSFGFGYDSHPNSCSEEDFTFSCIDSVVLNDTLSIPKNYYDNKKVVILVSPPSAISRDYYGLFKELADSLCSAGIAVLRFDNRAFKYKKALPENNFNMFDQASDIHYAIEAIQKDKRFFDAKIGLLGHSEGGCSTAIESSRNKKVSYIIVLSTIGIKGDDLAYYQLTKAILLRDNSDKSGIQQLVFSDWKKSISIVANNTNTDTLAFLLKKKTEETFYSHPELMGKLSLQKHIYSDSLFWLNRHRVAYIQYNPMLYYSNIACPTLAICGDADELIDYKSNLNGIKAVFDSVNKKNYTIKVLKNIMHDYQERNENEPIQFQPYMSRSGSKSDSLSKTNMVSNNKCSKELLAIVCNWIIKN